MSLQSVKYLQNLKNSNDNQYYNAFIISLIGLVGLSKVNHDNNKINLRLKQYRQVLNNINNNSLDIYVIVQDLFDSKMLTLNQSLKLIALLQKFRYDIDIDIILKDLLKILNELPQIIINKLSVDIKIILNTIDENNISDIVKRLYVYSKRKNMILDFVDIAKIMKWNV